jgi:DNA integrity scanning protein DisA with diadenylate cyclase activity
VSRILGHYAIFSRTKVGLFACYDYEQKREALEFTDIVALEHFKTIDFPIRRLRNRIEYSSADKLKNATKQQPEILAVVVSGGGRARVYHAGNEILEYQGNKWIFVKEGFNKFANDLTEKLRLKFKPKWNKEKVESLTETIRLISEEPGKGASFIIGDYKKLGEKKNGKRRSIPATELIRYVEGKKLLSTDKIGLLYQLAIMDGATIIDNKSFKVFGRRQLPMFDWRNSKYEKDWKDGESSRTWENYHKIYRWGMRHISALGITADYRSSLAIVISSDGPISVFENGRGIEELSYPPIVQ